MSHVTPSRAPAFTATVRVPSSSTANDERRYLPRRLLADVLPCLSAPLIDPKNLLSITISPRLQVTIPKHELATRRPNGALLTEGEPSMPSVSRECTDNFTLM